MNTRLLGPVPRVSESAGRGWVQRICISDMFSGDADASDRTWKTELAQVLPTADLGGGHCYLHPPRFVDEDSEAAWKTAGDQQYISNPGGQTLRPLLYLTNCTMWLLT